MKTRKRQRPKSPETDYEIGYCKPPAASRFKPGQSGNPKGRPKKQSSSSNVLENALRRKVRIIENGLEQRCENIEVLFRSLVSRAIKGDNRATQLLVQLIEKWQIAPPKPKVTGIKRVIVHDR